MVRFRVVAGLGLLLSASQAFAQVPFASSCAEDEHIETEKKKTIDAVAMNFIQAILGSSTSAAFDFMLKAGQAETTRQQMDGTAAAIIRQLGPRVPHCRGRQHSRVPACYRRAETMAQGRGGEGDRVTNATVRSEPSARPSGSGAFLCSRVPAAVEVDQRSAFPGLITLY